MALAACGGGDGGSSTPNPPKPPATNSPPTADAGTDQAVLTGAIVTLSGTGADSDGSVASYAWTQTEGSSVALTGASTATVSFTAPDVAASLTFRLEVTDNRGATHADTVAVIVDAPPPPPPPPPTAPEIVRQPTNPSTVEHGSALIFVVASGQDLNYEWHSSQSHIVKSGPEPFLLLEDRGLVDDDDCYHVVVSNGAGSATSEPGCITVEALGPFDLDPTDEDIDDEDHVSLAFGNTLFDIAQRIVGVLTGSTLFGANGLMQTMAGAPPEGVPCGYGGSFVGGTLDGAPVSQTLLLPLGRHTISMIWEGECRPTSDHTVPTMGGVLVTYDFPETFGVGSVTWHMSGHLRASSAGVSRGWMNGIVTATFATGFDLSGRRVDNIDISVLDGLSVTALRKSGSSSASNQIRVDRRFSADSSIVERSVVDFDVSLNFYDVEGFEGVVSQAGDGGLELNHDPEGEGGSSTDEFEVGIGPQDIGAPSYTLSTLVPQFGGNEMPWSFEVVPRPECPEGQVCVDP
ncbi:PKD domain-containing protein [Peristeroidobacter agariperforans]|uniref:PKD domain-containing protein n=1 Tax=Peristeroidobacter agariperforans TaxID=268404 RepID=UPI00101B9EA5|nr:PKD domain-containing protein [Peristeroidobacter agariperforans]